MASSNIEKLIAEYMAAAHALQSGIAAEMNIDPKPTEPKHLRTGINIAFTDHAAIVTLLIEKGIITEEEYYRAILKTIKKEVSDYEQKLSSFYKTKITLG